MPFWVCVPKVFVCDSKIFIDRIEDLIYTIPQKHVGSSGHHRMET